MIRAFKSWFSHWFGTTSEPRPEKLVRDDLEHVPRIASGPECSSGCTGAMPDGTPRHVVPGCPAHDPKEKQ